MIKVLVYWESGSGTPTIYTLKDFMENNNGFNAMPATYNDSHDMDY